MPTTIHGTNGITFNDGSTQNTRPAVGFRNRIINGDMRIDQRNAGASHTPVHQAYSIDRWNFQLSQASKLTAQRFAIASGQDQLDNNTYCLNAISTSAYSITASDIFLLGQFIEGFNCADLGWGTLGAKTVTISFWVTSSLTGTFGGSLQNAGINRSYPFTYSISSPNTWEKKTITIAGDTSGTWGVAEAIGIRLYFALSCGTTYRGTSGSWASAEYYSATGSTASLVGTNGAVFYITGVQLEVGSTATDFERRPYGTELALCQRYYCKTYSINTAPASITNEGAHQAMPYASATYRLFSQFQFPSEMRASPQVTMYSPNNGATGQWYGIDAAGNLAGGLEYAGTRSVCVTNPVAAASAAGRYLTHMAATSEL